MFRSPAGFVTSFSACSALGLAAALAPVPAAAQKMLDTVASPVFQVEGVTKAELARRAAVCLARNVRQEKAGPSTVQASDPDSGIVVASALFGYSSTGIPWTVRSTLTIETKDGRFRMTHTNLEQRQGSESSSGATSFLGLNPGAKGDWMPVGKWWGSGGDKVEAAANELDTRIVSCMTKPADDW